MKIAKNLLLLSLMSIIFLSSCRTEEFIGEPVPNENSLKDNSSVATAMQRTAMNDGSGDNILDMANCFTVKLPVNVTVNGIPISINTIDDLDLIEDNIEAFLFDDDIVNFEFPITVILNDFSEEQINDQQEYDELAAKCPGENEFDDDIECLDFVYPISASVFNTITENLETVTITSDLAMYNFIEALDDDLVVTVNFPISVILFDGTVVTVNSLDELENTIDSNEDACDEDDDYDFFDDDCVACTTNQLEAVLTGCSDWTVDRLDLGILELEDLYAGHLFNFNLDGTFTVQNALTTFSGTWSSSGSGENITVVLNIIGLPDFNLTWNLHELEPDKVDLRVGNNRLRFESDCN